MCWPAGREATGAGDPGGIPTTWRRVAAMGNPLTGGAQLEKAGVWLQEGSVAMDHGANDMWKES